MPQLPRFLPALALVLVLFSTPELQAQQEKKGTGDVSHRHIKTSQFPIPDWVADPNMRRMLEDFFKTQGGGGAQGGQNPQQREKMLDQLRRIMEQLPPQGRFPDPRALQGMQGYKDLLDSYRKMLESQPAPGDPELEDSLYEWMNDLAKDLKGSSPIADRSEGDSPPLLSPEGAELMRKLMGDVKLDPKLREEMKRSLAGLKDVVKDWREWFKDVSRADPRGTTRTGTAKTDPTTKPSDGAKGGGPAAVHPGGVSIPGLSSLADFPVREIFHGLLWASGIGLGLFALYLLWGMMGDRMRASLSRWRARPPRLPESFAGPEDFLRVYAPLMSFRIGKPLEGETHRELAHRDQSLHPSAGPASCEAADLFEALCYDRRALERAPELCTRAHAVCRTLLDSPA